MDEGTPGYPRPAGKWWFGCSQDFRLKSSSKAESNLSPDKEINDQDADLLDAGKSNFYYHDPELISFGARFENGWRLLFALFVPLFNRIEGTIDRSKIWWKGSVRYGLEIDPGRFDRIYFGG